MTMESKYRLCEEVEEEFRDKFYGMYDVRPSYEEMWDVAIDITWGDWKHEHQYANYLMSLLGYEFVGAVVTEDNGSDCYSGTHYYRKGE